MAILVSKTGKIKSVSVRHEHFGNITLQLVTGTSPYKPHYQVEWYALAWFSIAQPCYATANVGCMRRWQVSQGTYLLEGQPPSAPGTIELFTYNEPEDMSALSKLAGV